MLSKSFAAFFAFQPILYRRVPVSESCGLFTEVESGPVIRSTNTPPLIERPRGSVIVVITAPIADWMWCVFVDSVPNKLTDYFHPTCFKMRLRVSRTLSHSFVFQLPRVFRFKNSLNNRSVRMSSGVSITMVSPVMQLFTTHFSSLIINCSYSHCGLHSPHSFQTALQGIRQRFPLPHFGHAGSGRFRI